MQHRDQQLGLLIFKKEAGDFKKKTEAELEREYIEQR